MCIRDRGMEGTIGAKGKLFGKEIDVRIMTLTAAMMLQAGGPDPMWLDGRASLTYNLLMGTIKGSAQMSMSVGEKCVPPRTSPFDFPIILDTYPNEGETTQIDPFISPTATFTTAIDDEISVPDVNGNTHRSVSYTHLDVYKRQFLCRSVRVHYKFKIKRNRIGKK